MTRKYNISFASDNNANVHPKIMEALIEANDGHYISYGEDEYTEKALRLFKEKFGEKSQAYFVFNGTGANVLSLAAVSRPYNSIICSDISHINTDECGAVERFTGCKLLPLKSLDGKICVDEMKHTLSALGVEHHSQPGVISITQSTELGTVYTVEEIKEITSFARKYNMLVHMDGARIANAAAALNVSLKEMTADAGIDILSFGASKNGGMIGEAVVAFNPHIGDSLKYIRKQGMQLASKLRYISAQFIALLEDDLWLKNAVQANKMAVYLAERVSQIPGISILRPVETNGVFVSMPCEAAERLIKEYYFYHMGTSNQEIRWLVPYDTTKDDIDAFVGAIEKSMA